MQIPISVFLRGKIALRDHVFLQIEPRDFHLAFSDFCEIIIQDKCEVGFAAAEVDDMKRSLLRKILIAVIHHLEETVDLAEFVLHRIDNLALFREDPHIHKRRNVGSFADQIILLSVMGKLLLLGRSRLLMFRNENFAAL